VFREQPAPALLPIRGVAQGREVPFEIRIQAQGSPPERPVSRIVLATWGSFGDVHPYLAVGIGLKQRGHDVTLATSEFYRSKVEGEGLRFHAVRPDIGQWIDDRETIRKANDLRTGTAFLMDRLVMPYLGQSYEELLEACRCA